MALSLENQNLVWQKVRVAFDALDATKQSRESFKALKERIATLGGTTRQLQFVAMADITGDTIIADVPCKLYGVFLKKQATATDAFFKMNDSTTTCGAANGASATDSVALVDSGDQVSLVFPKGRAQANGLTVASQTNLAGNTDSTSGDGPNGFIIIGAA